MLFYPRDKDQYLLWQWMSEELWMKRAILSLAREMKPGGVPFEIYPNVWVSRKVS